MKRYLPFLSIAFLMAACTSTPATTETKVLPAANQPTIDTAGLAQFQQWKTQNELTAANPVQEPLARTSSTPVKTTTIIREVVVEKQAPVRKRPAPIQKQKTTPPVASTTDKPAESNEGSMDNESAGTAKEPVVTPEPTAKKEGWSKAAKGAAIGGAGGAVIGAVINKRNPAVGAVIGGVLGGAVGYGIGHGKDKKDGRY